MFIQNACSVANDRNQFRLICQKECQHTNENEVRGKVSILDDFELLCKIWFCVKARMKMKVHSKYMSIGCNKAVQ